jgi:hypothetical protein
LLSQSLGIDLARIGGRLLCERYSIASGYETVLPNAHFPSPETAAAAAVGLALQS